MVCCMIETNLCCISVESNEIAKLMLPAYSGLSPRDVERGMANYHLGAESI